MCNIFILCISIGKKMWTVSLFSFIFYYFCTSIFFISLHSGPDHFLSEFCWDKFILNIKSFLFCRASLLEQLVCVSLCFTSSSDQLLVLNSPMWPERDFTYILVLFKRMRSNLCFSSHPKSLKSIGKVTFAQAF